MNDVVIGLGYGDEGKGLVTSYLSEQHNYKFNVRYSGGPQAGHTVQKNGKRHVFSTFGSGHAPTFLTSDVLFDPICFMEERTKLVNNCFFKNSATDNFIVVDKNCQLITPFDVLLNRYRETARGSNKHGSCGRGIFETKLRAKNDPSTIIRYSDFYNKSEDYLTNLLSKVEEYYLSVCEAEGFNPGNNKLIIPYTLEKWLEARTINCDETYGLCNHVSTISNTFSSIDLLFESSQGILLDEDYGEMPYCTPSKVGLQTISGYNPKVNGVTRAYTTRHGAGPKLMFEGNNFIVNENFSDQTNQLNLWQNKLRIGSLSMTNLNYAVSKTGLLDRLFITCCDHVDELIAFEKCDEKMLSIYKPFEKADEIFGHLLKPNGEIFLSFGPETKDIISLKDYRIENGK